MSNYLLSWFNNNFMVVILCLIVLGVATALLLSKNPKWISNSPSIITTIGIACTFFGVSSVLLNMNNVSADNMDQLMDGLKTTFIPSTEAIIFAVMFKFIDVSRQSDLTKLFYDEIKLNNEYLHALMNYHVPGFNLPPQEIKQQSVILSREKNHHLEMLKSSIQRASLVVSKNNRLAVVILYDKLTMEAPIVTAKAKGSNAKAILKFAKENKQLIIINDRMLATQLYLNSQVGKLLTPQIEELILPLLP